MINLRALSRPDIVNFHEFPTLSDGYTIKIFLFGLIVSYIRILIHLVLIPHFNRFLYEKILIPHFIFRLSS